MDNKKLEQRIITLEKQLRDLQTSSSIPDNLDKSLQGRGFLKSNNFIVAGRATVGVAGFSRIPIPGATSESVAYVTYADFPGSGGVPVAYIQFNIDHYELYIDADYGYNVNYIVFLNNKGNFNNSI